MKTILIADIFGKTPALLSLAKSLSGEFELLDPYGGEMLNFTDEAHAYEYFIEYQGIEHYATSIEHYLRNITEPVSIVAFSVGAAALWQVSNALSSGQIKSAYCFYGSQIRHYPTLTPAIPMTLIFPKMEAHFSVPALIEQLATTTNVTIEQSVYLHGFMNECSVNFDSKGMQHYLSFIQSRAEN